MADLLNNRSPSPRVLIASATRKLVLLIQIKLTDWLAVLLTWKGCHKDGSSDWIVFVS
jgi:hypothetical protein